MTKLEAIETIRKHYPPENYTDLREALDIAIEVLNKQYLTEQCLNHIKVDCNSAEINEYSECLGFSYDNDDEPIEVCKNCFRHIGYGEE